MASRPLALLVDHKEDAVEKDFGKKLKVDDDKDLGDNTHLPVPMSCDDPKVVKNDLGDNSLKPDVLLFSEEEARKQFQTFCEEYEVECIDEEEERHRFSIFKKRLEWIAQQQNKGKPVAHNDLGDNSSLKPNEDLFSEAEARQHFQSWCEDFEVKYVDEEEERYRFSVFKERLEWITHEQSKGEPVAMNNLADQTEDEIVSLLFCKNCDSESDTEQDHTQEPHAEKEKGYLSEDASEDDAFD